MLFSFPTLLVFFSYFAVVVVVITMGYNIEPIRIQESCCIFSAITSNLPNIHHAHISNHINLLVTVFSKAWYKLAMHWSLIVYHGLKVCVCTKKYKWLVRYSMLSNTGSLGNAIQEFSLALQSWVTSHYTMLYKYCKHMRHFLGCFHFYF